MTEADNVIYVMTLDYFEDDWKRPDASSEVIGARTDQNEAYKAVFKAEFQKNMRCYDDFEDEESADTRKKPKECKYKQLAKKLDKLKKINDKFIKDWHLARNEAIGPSQCGVNATGYTARVTKVTVDEEPVVDSDKDE
jgi:hypothetical protein